MEQETTSAMQHDGIRTLAAGRGVEWLVGGFKIVFKTPAFWIVAGLIILIANVIANYLPLIGGAVVAAVYTLASGAAMRACAAIEAGRDPVAEAQQALSHQPLLILAAIFGGISLLIVLVVGAMIAASLGAAVLVGASAGYGMAIVNGLILTVLFIALFMAFWLAPALVLFNDMQPLDAMKMSLKATMKNLLPYLVLAILTCVAVVIGSIPVMLGLLVVLPASMCAAYIAYQEMFA
jgi:uncharacterized membrane protein